MENEIKWSKTKSSQVYTTKMGYVARMEEEEVREQKW
jgi:hypothetical protein